MRTLKFVTAVAPRTGKSLKTSSSVFEKGEIQEIKIIAFLTLSFI